MDTAVISSNVERALTLIDSMAVGESQILYGVSWDDYEELLAELESDYAVRIAYTEGELEIRSPLYRHDKHKEMITAMTRIMAKLSGYKLEAAGSTTLKRKEYRRGVEPDGCFYIQHAEQMIGKDELDLRFDPPPDLVVEVDITSMSTNQFRTYARLGVPEFWRYDGNVFRIYELIDGNYLQCQASPTFPFMTGDDLAFYLEKSKVEGQDAALDQLQEWVKERVKLA